MGGKRGGCGVLCTVVALFGINVVLRYYSAHSLGVVQLCYFRFERFRSVVFCSVLKRSDWGNRFTSVHCGSNLCVFGDVLLFGCALLLCSVLIGLL